jgi:phosphatidylglycerophosphate synthase
MVNKIPSHQECPVDVLLLGAIDTHLDYYERAKISPNAVTTCSIVCGIYSAYCILHRRFTHGALFFAAAYYFDCVDGKLARKFNKVTVFGDYYDHFGDLFKLVIVMYAIHRVKPKAFRRVRHWFLLLATGMLLHLGVQERLYTATDSAATDSAATDSAAAQSAAAQSAAAQSAAFARTTSESPSLNFFKYIIPKWVDPAKLIQFTKYIGCGTFMFIVFEYIMSLETDSTDAETNTAESETNKTSC